MMKLKTIMTTVILSVACLAFGKVSGNRVEVYGTQWPISAFNRWVAENDSLLTPETSNLAVQACLRSSQEALDAHAYALANQLVTTLAFHYSNPRSHIRSGYDRAL